jgi:hypothetical protein
MTKSHKLTANVTTRDLVALDEVVAHFSPFARRHSIYLAAFRLGLRAIARDPSLVESVAGASSHEDNGAGLASASSPDRARADGQSREEEAP